MTTTPYQETSTSPIGGGMFDNLPEGPWKILPLGINAGFLLPACVATCFFDATGEPSADFEFFGLHLTVRNVGTIKRQSGDEARVFHIIGDEFEVLMLLPADTSCLVMSCRGSSTAYADAARTLFAGQSALAGGAS